MTFFEAWEKADEGELIGYKGGTTAAIKKHWYGATKDTGGADISQSLLFEKGWSIVKPNTKKVTIDIPEEVASVVVHYDRCEYGHRVRREGIGKITYEVEEK